MDTARTYAKLASRFGFTAVGYRAEGRVDGTTVTLTDVRIRDLAGGVCIRAPLVRPLDLLLSIATGVCAPRAVTEEHQATGDPELDGWVVVWGKGEVERAVALLGPELRMRLRALTGAVGIKITDTTLEALVDASTSVDAQEQVLRELVVLRSAVDAATRDVPVAKIFSDALPAFERFARELGVDVTTCTFGLRGVVDGCTVDVFRFLPGGPKDDVLLIHVDFPAPLAADVLLNSHLGTRLWPRIRSLLSVLLSVGPKPGWWSFGTRFKIGRGTFTEVRRAFGGLKAISELARVDGPSFLNVTSDRLITGARMSDPRHPPDLVARIRALVAAAKAFHGVATMGDAQPPRGGPYR